MTTNTKRIPCVDCGEPATTVKFGKAPAGHPIRDGVFVAVGNQQIAVPVCAICAHIGEPRKGEETK